MTRLLGLQRGLIISTTTQQRFLSQSLQMVHLILFLKLGEAVPQMFTSQENLGFYDILERYDEVMADRGFTISEDLLLHHARLHIPPGKRGQEQLSKAEVKKTKEIANLRIYVEQAIRRLKTFRLIKYELPISLLENIDDIVIVCAAICNLYKPLCK